jgi:HEAT repeat protein
MTTPRQTRSSFPLLFGALAFAVATIAGGGHAQAQTPASSPTLDQILKDVATYDGGIDSAALWKLRDYVYAHKDSAEGRAECEKALIQFLKTNATPVAKMTACRYLRLIGSDTAVPPLEAMLADEKSADMALYALQQIPGAAAEAALIRAVKTTTGPTRMAVVGALGFRKDAAAVTALVPLLRQPDVSGATAVALGRIGGGAAATALVAAFSGAAPDLKGTLASSILLCADSWLAAKNTLEARSLYETLSADKSLPAPLRRAAAIGRISTAGSSSTALLLQMLGGSDPVQQDAAIAKMAEVVAPGAIGQVCMLLPQLPERRQVQVLAALSGYPAGRVRSTILEAARSDSLPVRLAAIQALEPTGGASAVPLLLEKAVRTSGPEQTAARVALGQLKGREVDDAILALLGKKPAEDDACELLLMAADRSLFAAKSATAALLDSPSARVRAQALKTLRVIGTPSDVDGVLKTLVHTSDDSERDEAEMTVAALAKKTANADGRASAVRAQLMTEKNVEARVRLIGVLPLIGDPSTLSILRQSLKDSAPEVVDAAVHAITSWPTDAARDDLLRLARESKNDTHRLLALRSLISSVGQDRYREPEAAVADLKAALALAERADERRLVLGALAKFPCQDALDVAAGLLKEPGVEAEAQAAVANIKASLARPGGRRGRGGTPAPLGMEMMP